MQEACCSPEVETTDTTGLAGRGIDTRSVEELEEEIAELCAHIDAATYRLLRAIGEVDRREAWPVGFLSMAHWLSWRVGIDLRTAREKVRVARALEDLPLISEAFRQGRMSYSKVRAMCRIATPDNEEYLLYIAENGTTEDVERVVRGYRRASRDEDMEEARRHREERYLEMYPDDDGMVVIRGRLPREVAALVEKALEAAMDSLSTSSIPLGDEGDSQQTTDDDPRDGSAEPREGPEAMLRSVIPASAGMTAAVHGSAEPWLRGDFAQRRVDALGLVAEAALGKGLAQTDRREPYQVMIHVDSAVLADESQDGLCELETGDGISAETCRRLACDAPHVTAAEDEQGNILNMGRKARKISTPLWRALASRDRICRFPGCNRTRHLQAHHIEHWAKGGETSMENICLVCRAHHWAVHEGGIQVQGRAPHGLVFRWPEGKVIPASPERIPINGEAGETLKEANRRVGLELSAHTVDRFWDGEVMDLHMAVDGVLDCEDDPIDEQ
jgi:hypothetical protein